MIAIMDVLYCSVHVIFLKTPYSRTCYSRRHCKCEHLHYSGHCLLLVPQQIITEMNLGNQDTL